MICPKCRSEWTYIKYHGQKRIRCNNLLCRFLDERDSWVDGEYHGPKEIDPIKGDWVDVLMGRIKI